MLTNFVTTALNVVFSEARKYGLYLTVANQFLGQLRGDTLDAVMGNVGASVVFQTSPDDAQELAPYFRPEFERDDMVNFDLYHAAVKMRSGKQTLPAFSIETRKPVEEPDNADEREAMIRARSIKLYTPKTRQEVLEWLRKRYPRPTFDFSDDEEGNDDKDDEDPWVVPD